MTHISMHYAELSYNIYKKHELYSVRRIPCHFVIAGNYDDLEFMKKLSPTFKKHEKVLSCLKVKILTSMPPHFSISVTAITKWTT